MQKLVAINFPDEATKREWLLKFARASKQEQQAMATEAAVRWPVLDGSPIPGARIN